MDKNKEQKIIKFIFLTIIFMIFLIVWPYSIKDLYKDITKDIGETAIITGKIIEKGYTKKTFTSSSNWKHYTNSIITVEYTVNGKNYTIKHTNRHSWENNKIYKIGDKKEVIYNIYNPSNAYLKLSSEYYISFVFWTLAGIIFIAVYILSTIFIIRNGRYN